MNRSVDAARQSMTTRFAFSNAAKMPSSVAPFGQIEKARVGMKPFQRRVLVVAVNRDMGNALVFEDTGRN